MWTNRPCSSLELFVDPRSIIGVSGALSDYGTSAAWPVFPEAAHEKRGKMASFHFTQRISH